MVKIFKHFFLKIPQWPDFKIFCGDWGGHDIIGTTFGSSCTFHFCWGSFKRVVNWKLEAEFRKNKKYYVLGEWYYLKWVSGWITVFKNIRISTLCAWQWPHGPTHLAVVNVLHTARRLHIVLVGILWEELSSFPKQSCSLQTHSLHKCIGSKKITYTKATLVRGALRKKFRV